MKHVLPYLIFDGDCREAMRFYHQCLGGELFEMTFAEADAPSPPEAKDRLVHAAVKREAFMLMASDTMPGMPFTVGNNVSVYLACDSDDEVQSLYDQLTMGGKEGMKPHDAFWGARFAMLIDRFGVNWMLAHEHAPAGSPAGA